MLNRILFNKKDVIISNLRKEIEDFKEYDKRRKEYYRDSMLKLGQLESYIQELEEGSLIPKLKEKIATLEKRVANQREELNSLQLVIKKYKKETEN